MDAGFRDLDPSRVAVVLVDFQNDFCHPAACAPGEPTNTHNAATAVRANEFARRAVEVGAHVVYTRQVLDLDRLTPRQRRHETPDGLCAKDSWGAELYVPPVDGAAVVTKYRFDCWQSEEFQHYLDAHDIDGLVVTGVELVCCVLYAVLGAQERGYHYLVPQDLVSGQDPGDETDNKAVRELLRHNQPEQAIESSRQILDHWSARS